MTARENYLAAVREQRKRGLSQSMAERYVQRHKPRLYRALTNEADANRHGRKPAPTPAQSAATLTLENLLRRAIAGERFDDVAIYAVCRPRHKTVNWFHSEVARERSHKSQERHTATNDATQISEPMNVVHADRFEILARLYGWSTEQVAIARRTGI